MSPLFHNMFNIEHHNFMSQITFSFVKCGCSIYFFLNSAEMIYPCRDISKYFRESLVLRDNESRLYVKRKHLGGDSLLVLLITIIIIMFLVTITRFLINVINFNIVVCMITQDNFPSGVVCFLLSTEYFAKQISFRISESIQTASCEKRFRGMCQQQRQRSAYTYACPITSLKLFIITVGLKCIFKRTTTVLICLHRCADCSRPLLSVYVPNSHFHILF